MSRVHCEVKTSRKKRTRLIHTPPPPAYYNSTDSITTTPIVARGRRLPTPEQRELRDRQSQALRERELDLRAQEQQYEWQKQQLARLDAEREEMERRRAAVRQAQAEKQRRQQQEAQDHQRAVGGTGSYTHDRDLQNADFLAKAKISSLVAGLNKRLNDLERKGQVTLAGGAEPVAANGGGDTVGLTRIGGEEDEQVEDSTANNALRYQALELSQTIDDNLVNWVEDGNANLLEPVVSQAATTPLPLNAEGTELSFEEFKRLNKMPGELGATPKAANGGVGGGAAGRAGAGADAASAGTAAAAAASSVAVPIIATKTTPKAAANGRTQAAAAEEKEKEVPAIKFGEKTVTLEEIPDVEEFAHTVLSSINGRLEALSSMVDKLNKAAKADDDSIGSFREVLEDEELRKEFRAFLEKEHSEENIVRLSLFLCPSLFLSLSISFYLSIYLSIYLYLSISIYLYLSLSLSIYIYIYNISLMLSPLSLHLGAGLLRIRQHVESRRHGGNGKGGDAIKGAGAHRALRGRVVALAGQPPEQVAKGAGRGGL